MRSRLLFAATPLLVAGLLPHTSALDSRWPWAGAWLNPVGDPFDFGEPGPDGGHGYEVLRGVSSGHARPHRGADLGNGRAGGTVRAAANGVVVQSEDGEHRGYGTLVVLAHRTPDGPVTYSVYAHLRPGSALVRKGETVVAGQPLGRVGRSGRASTDHLHFEVREARDPHARWEHARVVPPTAFVVNRLPRSRADTTWAAPWLVWAECAGLLPRDARGDRPMERRAWQAMLARATMGGETLDSPPSATRGDPDDPVRWRDLAEDLRRCGRSGFRVPPPSGTDALRRAECARRLALREPARDASALERRSGEPTLGEACLLLADRCAESSLTADSPHRP